MIKANRILAAVTVLFGGFIIWLSTTTSATLSKYDVGTGFFPALLGVLLVVLGIVLFLQNIKKKSDEKLFIGDIRTVLFFALMGAYVYLMEFLGFILDSLWIMPVISVIIGCKKPKTIILSTIISVALIYIAFRYGFKVILPKGLLKGIL